MIIKVLRIKKTNNKNEEAVLTQKGEQRILKYKIDDLVLPKRKRWDAIWRVVIFDIPETKRSARNALGRKLKQLGFYTFQKSVYVFPHPCLEEIEVIVSYFNIQKYTHYLEARSINHDTLLKKYFNLM